MRTTWGTSRRGKKGVSSKVRLGLGRQTETRTVFRTCGALHTNFVALCTRTCLFLSPSHSSPTYIPRALLTRIACVFVLCTPHFKLQPPTPVSAFSSHRIEASVNQLREGQMKIMNQIVKSEEAVIGALTGKDVCVKKLASAKDQAMQMYVLSFRLRMLCKRHCSVPFPVPSRVP